MSADPNVTAFLRTIVFAEGTARDPRTGRALDPYRVCYGYAHTVKDMSDHPALTGEWKGERLPADMCRRAGYPNGVCYSSAAGAYQIIKPTWVRLKARLGLTDFGPGSQDLAAIDLIRSRGALSDVLAGRFDAAVRKCSVEWASLPGNLAGQPQRRRDDLVTAFVGAGGTVA